MSCCHSASAETPPPPPPPPCCHLYAASLCTVCPSLCPALIVTCWIYTDANSTVGCVCWCAAFGSWSTPTPPVPPPTHPPHHGPPPHLLWHTIITPPRCPWHDPHADVREGFWVHCGFQGVWVTDLVIKWKKSRAEREGAPRHLRSFNASRGKALCSTWPLFVLQGNTRTWDPTLGFPPNGRLWASQQHTASHFCNTSR